MQQLKVRDKINLEFSFSVQGNINYNDTAATDYFFLKVFFKGR